jgi:hypothetical protein
MIQQRIGDLLQIEEVGGHVYVVVLTKAVMFGGNILFAFHGDGRNATLAALRPAAAASTSVRIFFSRNGRAV